MEQQEQNIRGRPSTSCESGAEQKLANKNVLNWEINHRSWGEVAGEEGERVLVEQENSSSTLVTVSLKSI